MAWSWSRVWDVDGVGNIVFRLAKTKLPYLHFPDGLLWALVDGLTLYRSYNGTSWAGPVDRPAWSGRSNVCSNHSMFNHQGLLYVHVGQTLYEQYAYGLWNTICSGAANEFWFEAATNDDLIIIAGSEEVFEHVGAPESEGWGGAIWRWDGSTLTQEFVTDGTTQPRALRCVTPFYDTYTRKWYCHVRYGNSYVDEWDTVFIRDDAGNWSLFRTCTRGDGDSTYRGNCVQFCTSPYGMFFGGELYDHDGNWADTLFPGDAGVVVYLYGEVIIVRHDGDTPPPPSNIGKTYTYNGGTGWTYRGEIEPIGVGDVYPTYISNILDFRGQLYTGGRRGYYGAPAKTYRTVWQLGAETDTTTTGWPEPTARQLVCDHEAGDTLYLAVYNDSGNPIMMSLDPDFDWWEKLYDPSSGSFMGVQTALVRDVAYAFGYLGTDNQIQITADAGFSFSDADDDWGEDKITTMEYLPTAGSDLTITNYEDEDLLRTTSGSAFWTKQGDVPGPPLSQLRDSDVIFVGCTGGDLYKSEDIGQTFAQVGTGLPAVDILDLELA